MTYIYIRIYIYTVHTQYIHIWYVYTYTSSIPYLGGRVTAVPAYPGSIRWALMLGGFFFDPIKTRYPKYNTTVNLNALVGEIMEWKWESYFLNHGRSSEWCSWGRCKESQIIKMLILSKFCMRDAQTLLGVCRYVKSLQIPSLCVRNTNLSINSALQRPPLRVLQDSFCLFLGKQ